MTSSFRLMGNWDARCRIDQTTSSSWLRARASAMEPSWTYLPSLFSLVTKLTRESTHRKLHHATQSRTRGRELAAWARSATGRCCASAAPAAVTCGAWTGGRLDLVDPQALGALRDDRRDDRRLVGLAELEARRLFAHVLIAPLAKRGQRDIEVETLLRQLVLVPLRALAIEDALEHALVDQPVEPVSQNVAGDSEALLQFVEAVEAQQDVADDQQRPALADDLERSGDRAVLAFVVTVQHRRQW